MLRLFLAVLFISGVTEFSASANPVNNTCIEPNPPERRIKYYINEWEPCSGRGTCVDGQCTSCRTWTTTSFGKTITLVTSGKYCECDNMSCPTFNGKVCAGHGRCDCGQCVCDEGYTFAECSEEKSVVQELIKMLTNDNKNQNKTST
ncbi:integrin beta-8-like [Paramacrobiotus metropolitanus]|uniref:integrin beta-8-like n=1 Tax=Paramacrobiotus metropolitanus TaxID=2943436 RepID=UPI002445BD1C|nr:integrin beta-8-like [Paramacrobiotus metropolitanus]